jgi:N-acetylglucosaminyldiphosphoundecaprenol N-acetyl-beta-D-mannosaminyltransferase
MSATVPNPAQEAEASISPPRDRVRVGGALVDVVCASDALARFDAMIASGGRHYACFCEAHLCVQAARDARVRKALERASIVLPDGVASTWGARLLGRKLPDRLSGPRVMLDLCRHGVDKGYRHFFYGGAEGIAERLAERLTEAIPGLKVAGTCTPPFRTLSPEEESAFAAQIEQSHADILWVALGAPKQELWVADHAGKINVPLMLAVGAAFDFHSGNRKWAPPWIRKIGLEWVYRMLTGGKRVFIRNAKNESMFTFIILKQAIGHWCGWLLGPKRSSR